MLRYMKVVSRYLGSQDEIFTAGGSSSDIEIQGIEKNKPKTSNNC
jgi:hypothetical protein